MQKFLRRLERFSQSYLSAAGLLLVLGALLTSKPLCQALPVLQWAPLQLVGQLLYNGMMVLINNLSVILCVGVAAVRAKTEKQDAALLALMAYLVFLTANHTALEALGLLAQPNGMTGLAGTGQTTILGIQVVDTGVASGIVLGFAAALSSVGIEAQMGGSAFSKALIKMEVASATGGDALEDFGKVAGMTGQQFKALWDSDPAAAFAGFQG